MKAIWRFPDEFLRTIVEEDAREAGWKKGLEEGRVKGHAEGRAEGHAEGKVEGRAEGKAEEKRAIARNMKAIGLTLEQIKTATGLTENEIEAL